MARVPSSSPGLTIRCRYGFVDDGFVLLPAFFHVFYAYGFVEHLAATDGSVADAWSVGAGLGVQATLFHFLPVEFRVGAAFTGLNDKPELVFR